MSMLVGGTLAGAQTDYNGAVKDLVKPIGSNQMGYAYQYLSWFDASVQTNYTSGSTRGIFLGTGTTAPTLDDYKMSGDVISGISVSVSHAQEIDDTGVLGSKTITITNNNSSAITISEIGWFGYLYYTITVNGNAVLLDRTVLDSPVTIPAGGVGQVTYTIRMNYPTA